MIRIVAIAVTLLWLAGPASALDMCFYLGPSYLFVAKSYKRPSRGSCRPLTGYEASTAVPNPASGAVCMNAAGNKLYVYWSTVNIFLITYRNQYSSKTELPYPALTGGTTEIVESNTGGNSTGTLTGTSAAACQPSPMP